MLLSDVESVRAVLFGVEKISKTQNSPVSETLELRTFMNRTDTSPQENGRIILSRPGINQLDMTIYPLKWHDTANYTCKARNRGGYHEWNGTVIVYCEFVGEG